MITTTLGIDLGGCMSGNSAYALITWTGKKAEIIELIKEPKHKNHQTCLTFLKELLSNYRFDAIAIDAPFSLPRALIEPTFKAPPRELKGEISNPYLFRYTDYWLYQTYGLRPMPPAGDRIGRLTARMIEMLQYFDYQPPFLTLPQGKVKTYEVYPKQIALALGFDQYKHKTQEVLDSFNISNIDDEHLVDAILASYCASEILHQNTIFPLEEAKDEGWCYPLSVL